MHLDINHNSTTIWTVDDIDELITDIDELITDIERAKTSKVKRAETLDNLKRIFLDIREQDTIIITKSKLANDAE